MDNTQRDDTLSVKQLIKDSDRGYLNDRVEEFLPDTLFGPPTIAEAGEAPSMRSISRASKPSRRHATPAARRKRAH